MDNPFTITVYDKNFAFKGYVGDPISLTVTPRYNQVGTAVLVVDLYHRLAPALMDEGARLTIHKDGDFVMSGKIALASGEGPQVTATLTLTLRSDFRLMQQVLGWPVPSAALTSQTNAYHRLTGSAESVVKGFVTANMQARLGLPVTVAADLGRGGSIDVSMRFHPLFEKLLPIAETAGLGITFEQSGAGIRCDVFVPPVFPHVLSESSGALQSWSWSSADPTATRVVAGGQGEGPARAFVQKIDTALEALHGDKVEMFKDARDADTVALLNTRAQEALTEGAPQSGFVVKLSETGTYRYGRNGLVVGAKVTISVGGVTRTDILREVTMTYNRTDGLLVVPVVGDIQDSPERTIARFLARLKRSVSDLKVSK